MPLADVINDDRSRKVAYQWVRKPGGKPLSNPGPPGLRTPEGFVWGHRLESFYWIRVVPGVNYIRVYSRSMLKEFGELYSDDDFDHPEPPPRVRKPWPVLCSRRVLKSTRTLNDEDTGSDHEDEEESILKPNQKSTLLDMKLSAQSMKLDVDVIADLDLSEFLVDNDPEKPVKSDLGHTYMQLWASQFRPFVKELFENGLLMPLDFVGLMGKDFRKVADEIGILAVSVPAERAYDDGHVRSILRFIHPDKVKETLAKDTNCGLKPDLCVHAIKQASPSSANRDPTPSVLNKVYNTRSASIRDSTGSGSKESSQSGSLQADTEDKEDVEMNLENGDESANDCDEYSSDEDSTEKCPPPERGSPFFMGDLPKLEEFIPEEHFPDTLIVHDADEARPLKYVRIYPHLPRDSESESESDSGSSEPERVAHLHTHAGNAIGKGHHSFARRAALTLPSPLCGHSCSGQVTVAAKTAQSRAHARKLLRREARMYGRFPRHIQQEYCGFQLIRPIKHPVPTGPVVPKFYGYYVPTNEKGEAVDNSYREVEENKDYTVKGPSPILLMEECGEPINPSTFSLDDRSECYSLVLRLHRAGFIQNSFYTRNILMQRGPLTVPPSERSHRTPSFRIIDFGRGDIYDNEELMKYPKEKRQRVWDEFCQQQREEDHYAHKALKLDMGDY